MKTLRIVFGILAIIPVALLIYHFFASEAYYEDSLITLLYFVLGIPILIVNLWTWGAPDTMKDFLSKEDK